MKATRIDDAFFQGDALLLVEDAVTAAALRELWSRDAQTMRITVRSVGGREPVTRLVQAAEQQGHRHVFGFVDRDFGPQKAGPRLFSTHAHEIESELLDLHALAALSNGETATEIETKLQSIASTMVSWSAARAALQQMKQSRPDLPREPSIDEVPDAATARAWLKKLDFSARNLTAAREWTATYLADTIFVQCEVTARGDIASGEWRSTFPGKEILERALKRIDWRRKERSAEDLAKRVAAHWHRHKSAPLCITAVRDAIVKACEP